MENNCLAGKILCIILREGDVDVLLFAGAHADQLFFEARNKGVGTKLESMAFGLAAIKRLSIQEAFKVDVHGVAHLGRALYRQHTRIALLDVLDFIINRLFRNSLSGADGLKTLILAEDDFRIGRYVKGKLAGLFIRHIDVGNTGLADNAQLALFHTEFKSLGCQIVHRILIKDFFSIHALNDLTRGLALAETGDVDILFVLQISAVDSLFKFGCIRGNCKYCSIVLFLLDIFQNHGIIPPHLHMLWYHNRFHL